MRIHFSVPLLSGFFATYLPSQQRPLHTVAFLTPINDDPSAESTAEACLRSTKELLVDTGYQQEAVVVVDEKIYRSCVKVSWSFLLRVITWLSSFLDQTATSWFIWSYDNLRRRFSSDEEHNDCHMGYSWRIGTRRNTRAGLQRIIIACGIEVRCVLKTACLVDNRLF